VSRLNNARAQERIENAPSDAERLGRFSDANSDALHGVAVA